MYNLWSSPDKYFLNNYFLPLTERKRIWPVIILNNELLCLWITPLRVASTFNRKAFSLLIEETNKRKDRILLLR